MSIRKVVRKNSATVGGGPEDGFGYTMPFQGDQLRRDGMQAQIRNLENENNELRNQLPPSRFENDSLFVPQPASNAPNTYYPRPEPNANSPFGQPTGNPRYGPPMG